MFSAIDAPGRAIACFAEFGVDIPIAAARSKCTIGIAAAVDAGVFGFAEVAGFVFALEFTITAIGGESHASGHTFIFSISAVVLAIVANFAGIGGGDAIAAGRNFAVFHASAVAVVVVFAATITFLAPVFVDDAITAIPLAGVAVAERIGIRITFFAIIDMIIAAV